MSNRSWVRIFVLLLSLAAACTGANSNQGGPGPGPTDLPPPPVTAILVGAGDIGDCISPGADGGVHAEATARLLDRMAYDSVFTAGDNAYFDGTAAQFSNCYASRWGRHKSRTFPSPGNHEYQVSSAPYFDYFGDRAGPRGAGFYSYNLGNWHIVSLNSNVGVLPNQEQYLWLKRDLEDNKSRFSKCNLAYWHHPLFTSGPSAGTNALMRDVWQLLFEYGFDVVINGHDHLYERFEMQDQNARRDTQLGIREYIVGTGGAPLYEFGPTAPNSLFKLRAFGVLKLTLRDVSYDSVFIEAGSEMPYDFTFNNLCH
jgi:calcineurin-like phosphoesterase family protein